MTVSQDQPIDDPPALIQAPTDVAASRRWARALSFRNISAVYIFVVIFAVFALWIPDIFLQASVWRTLLDAQTVTAIAALAALVPLVTGTFDLAIGSQVGFAGVLVAHLLSATGLPVWLAVVLTILAGTGIGLVSSFLITAVKIDSFIATLGLSSVLIAGVAWVSNSQLTIGLDPGFHKIATTQWFGVTVPVYVLLAVSLAVWYVMEQTPVGRRMYATGFNPDGARLAGVKVPLLRIGGLLAGGSLAALAGTLMSARVNAGDPTAGPSILLPALSAVFLGSTQFRGGRFNVWGTIVAVYVLAVGIKGLQLVGAPSWINDLFNGLALLLAVGLSRLEKTSRRTAAIRRLISRKRSPS